MSLDVFLQSFENGNPQGVATTDIVECAREFITEQAETYLELVFGPADSCTLYLDTNEPTVSGITVNRPCGDRRLANVLFRIMQLGNFVLYVPGEDRPLVVHPGTTKHLPDELIEAVGEPIVVTTVEEFRREFLPS